GQVVVENGYPFVGPMDPPHGTTILDVKDPKHLKVIARFAASADREDYLNWMAPAKIQSRFSAVEPRST
ncbi:MAG TPA: hypothetical protein VGB09_06865, partial [Candidatus Binatia bacterium]